MNNYKIRIIQYICLAIFLLNSSSCEKIELRKVDLNNIKEFSVLTAGDSSTIYSYVWLNGNQVISALDSNFRISAMAAFTDTITRNLVPMNGLVINTRSVIPNPDHTYSFNYSDTAAYLQEGLNLYGTNVKVKITGSSSADTITKTIYMPKKVLRYTTDFPLGQLNIGSNLTLNWTPDPACTWGNVSIKIYYKSVESRFLSDSTLSANDTTLSYIVADNGSYTISSADLQKLKRNSLVTLEMGRGSQIQAVLPVSLKRVFYYATSAVSTYTLTLICTANWQNTGLTQCQVNGSGFNTGYQLVQQKDLSTCSPTYNQTRWITGSYNLSACPLPASILGYDSKTISYRVAFTNTSTNTVYNFTLNANTNTYYSVGQIPNGNYNVTFNGIGQPTSSAFYANGYTQYGLNASFTNIPFTATSDINVH